jgi:hypothetical protein
MQKYTFLFIVFILSFTAYGKGPCRALYPIQAEGSSGTRSGYIDCRGNMVVAAEFPSASAFNDGVGIVKRFVKVPGKKKPATEMQSGIVDVTGQIVYLRDTNIISEFSEGLAFAQVKNKYAFIDKNGKVRIPIPKYVKLDTAAPVCDDFKNGEACLNGTDARYLVSKKGAFVRCKPVLGSCAFTDRTEAVMTEQGFALLSEKGTYLIEPQENPIYFSEGLFRLEAGAKRWRYYDKKGKLIFEAPYNYSGFFSEGLTVVQDGERWGYIDKDGAVRIPLKFDDASDFSEGLASVKSEGKYGFIDKTGKFVITPTYFAVLKPFYNDLAYVQSTEFIGYIDKMGKWIWKKSLVQR